MKSLIKFCRNIINKTFDSNVKSDIVSTVIVSSGVALIKFVFKDIRKYRDKKIRKEKDIKDLHKKKLIEYHNKKKDEKISRENNKVSWSLNFDKDNTSLILKNTSGKNVKDHIYLNKIVYCDNGIFHKRFRKDITDAPEKHYLSFINQCHMFISSENVGKTIKFSLNKDKLTKGLEEYFHSGDINHYITYKKEVKSIGIENKVPKVHPTFNFGHNQKLILYFLGDNNHEYYQTLSFKRVVPDGIHERYEFLSNKN